jgi:hypothetical protein
VLDSETIHSLAVLISAVTRAARLAWTIYQDRKRLSKSKSRSKLWRGRGGRQRSCRDADKAA